MPKKTQEPEIHKAAGLVRDFDVDETKRPQLNPWIAIGIPLALLVALIVVLAILTR